MIEGIIKKILKKIKKPKWERKKPNRQCGWLVGLQVAAFQEGGKLDYGCGNQAAARKEQVTNRKKNPKIGLRTDGLGLGLKCSILTVFLF